MREAVLSPDFSCKKGDEVRLPEGGKEEQEKAPGNPPSIVTDEQEVGHQTLARS